MAPFQAHSFIELGDNGVNISWVEDLFTQAEKSVLTAVSNPALYEMTTTALTD